MGIFSKILKFFSEEKDLGLKEKKIREIKLSELNDWISIQFNEINKKRKELKEQFDNTKLTFIGKTRQNISKLKEVDLSKYKVEEPTKIAVKQGLLTYMMHLNFFLDKIEKINEDIEISIEIANKELAKFEKNSLASYHKATILIGKEIGDIVGNIKDFSKYIKELYAENLDFFKKQASLKKIKEEFKKLNEKRDYEKQIDNSLLEKKENLKEKEKTEIQLKDEFEKFKNSQEYADELKYEQELKEKQEQLQDSLLEFKNDLNIQFLIEFFNFDEKNKRIIEKYEDDLLDAFKSDFDFEIMEIISYVLDTSKDYPDGLKKINKERIKDVTEKSFSLRETENNFKKPSLKYINGIKNIENAISDLKKELFVFEDKIKKAKEKQKETIKNLSVKLKEFDENLWLVEE